MSLGAESSKADVGPLHEIAFWKSRSEDLTALREQLDSAQITEILGFLEGAKSAYLPPFLSLRHAIQREAACAEDNLKFLLCLEKPCLKLAKAKPDEIPEMLSLILHSIRLIWNFSRFYNTTDRIAGLISKVSNELIKRCRFHIDLKAIFSGIVLESIALLVL